MARGVGTGALARLAAVVFGKRSFSLTAVMNLCRAPLGWTGGDAHPYIDTLYSAGRARMAVPTRPYTRLDGRERPTSIR